MKFIKATTFLLLLFCISILNGYCLKPIKQYMYNPYDLGIEVSDSAYVATTDGYRIFTCSFDSHEEKANKTIIISYGDAGNLSNYYFYAKQLMKYGYSVLLFDYRGFGKSEDFDINKDQLFYTEYAKDLTSVVNYARSKYPQNAVGVMAISMGTIAATLAESNTPVDFIIANNYVTHLDLIKERIDRLNSNGFSLLLPADITADEYLSKVRDIKVPMLVFSGTLDNITTLDDSNELLTTNPKCTITPYEGKHGEVLRILNNDYFKIIDQFLKETTYE